MTGTTTLEPAAHPSRPRATVVARGALVASLAFGVMHAPASTVEKCVARRMAAGETRTVALAFCLRNAAEATTPAPAVNLPGSSGGDGTSTGLLAGFGLGGVALGAGLTFLLRRRTPSPAGDAALPAAPAMPLPMPHSPGLLPGAVPPPVADRSPGLVAALIDLADRVPSQALRAEVLAALDHAGVHALAPAAGEVFDATRMRGIGSAAAPDAGWVGRVSITERPGFQDGFTVLRLPEVVVYTEGG
jgi:hypothetical protein